MSINHAVRVLLLSVLMTFATEAAAQTKTLRMPFYASPGQIWKDASGELQGVRVKVLKELNARLAKDGIQLKYVVAPEGQLSIKQAMQDIHDGKAEAYFGLIYSKAREDEGFTFGKEEIYSIPTVVWTTGDRRFTYRGLSSLKGKKIGVVAGYPFLDDVKNPQFEIDRTAPDDETNVRNLLEGRVDAIIDNLTRTGTTVIRMKAGDRITYSKEPFDVARFFIAYNKTVPADVVNKVDAALRAMRQGGVIKRIFDEAVYGALKS
jgi:polar amino acid transport system substrate-binding protein